VPKLKDELAQDPDNPLGNTGGVRGGRLVGGKQDVQCPARHRGLGGRAGAGEFEMSDIPSNLALPSATAKLSVSYLISILDAND